MRPDIVLKPVEVTILPDGRMDRINASLYMGVSIDIMQRWRKAGEGPTWYRPIPGRIWYYKSDIDEWIWQHEREPQPWSENRDYLRPSKRR